jgi:hypothetical protein
MKAVRALVYALALVVEAVAVVALLPGLLLTSLAGWLYRIGGPR